MKIRYDIEWLEDKVIDFFMYSDTGARWLAWLEQVFSMIAGFGYIFITKDLVAGIILGTVSMGIFKIARAILGWIDLHKRHWTKKYNNKLTFLAPNSRLIVDEKSPELLNTEEAK